MSDIFTSSPAPKTACIVGGYASGPGLCLLKIADEAFKAEAISGPWLCCYMLRRFGWPNSGSDDYKDLCSWTLTTPMRGLFLSVTPYLGGGNLHFAVRYTRSVQRWIDADPGRDAFARRKAAAIDRWWRTRGRHLYIFGCCSRDAKDETLIHKYGEDGAKVWGLYKRRPEHPRQLRLPRNVLMRQWWVGEIIEGHHKDVKLPKMTKRERARPATRFQIKAKAALRATLRDLLRPTNVRDISFSPFGDTERDERAAEWSNGKDAAGYFDGAGNTPEYWFSTRRKASKK